MRFAIPINFMSQINRIWGVDDSFGAIDPQIPFVQPLKELLYQTVEFFESFGVHIQVIDKGFNSFSIQLSQNQFWDVVLKLRW